MSTTIVNEAAAPPPPAPKPVHPPLPFGAGSYISFTGIAGAVAAFLLAWGENNWHLTGPIVTLGVTAGAIVLGYFQGRSHQVASIVGKVKAGLQEAGISVSDKPT